MLNKAVEIRLWLSDDFDDGQEVPVSDVTELREYVLNGKFPLRSSLSAQQLIRLPFALLGWAVYSFLAGFDIRQYIIQRSCYRTSVSDPTPRRQPSDRSRGVFSRENMAPTQLRGRPSTPARDALYR